MCVCFAAVAKSTYLWIFTDAIHTAGIVVGSSAGLVIKRVASSNPGRSGGRVFFSRVNFLCGLLFDVRSNPVLLQWDVKDPGHSARSTVAGHT